MASTFTVPKRTFIRLGDIVAALALALSIIMAGSTLAWGSGDPGAVYAMTNAVGGNEIVVYSSAADGTLTLVDTVSTGGLGGIGSPPEPVDALGSQGSLVLSRDNQWLFAVNAGSDEISVFRVERQGLTLVDVQPSGGSFPVSLTVDEDLLYVLNSGGDSNITGFTLDG
jgi:6-phosphogluconolactonase (cycloisomerase 2 family)